MSEAPTLPAPFLVTTALEQYWDTSGDVVFLGEWCRRYSRMSVWAAVGGRVLPSNWEDPERVPEACAYIAGVHERVLAQLGEALNVEHALALSPRAWRIMLGPWLIHYLPSLYDAYLSVGRALEAYPALTTVGPSEDGMVVPRDTLDFVQIAQEDPYNLQIFTRLLVSAGATVSRREFPAHEEALPARSSVSAHLKDVVCGVLRRAQLTGAGSIRCALVDSYLPKGFEARLMVSSGGAVRPIRADATLQPVRGIDDAARRRIRSRLRLREDAFEEVVGEMLTHDLPQSFVESLSGVRAAARARYPFQPRAIFSSNAWYFDEPFKWWAGESADGGTRLIAGQHGGTYGSTARSSSFDHEVDIADEFLSWGWTEAEGREVTPMPAGKLIGRPPRPPDPRDHGILFVGTVGPRYLFEIPYHEYGYRRYLERQLRFATALSPGMRTAMRARLHREDGGWDVAQRWRDEVPDVRLEGWDLTFRESLESCRLFVCDHLSTTFLEALSADRPTLLFWDPQEFALVPEAQECYSDLRSAGVLLASPEQAAASVEAIYEDVAAWWQDPDRRRAVRRFCERFALSVPDAGERWLEVLSSAGRPGTQR